MNFTMKCQKCGKEFPEQEIQISHDIPKYMGGTDSDGRHTLCKNCHKEYEKLILLSCLKLVEEELTDGDEISWMKELSMQSELLKVKFRYCAKNIKENFFKNSIGNKGVKNDNT